MYEASHEGTPTPFQSDPSIPQGLEDPSGRTGQKGLPRKPHPPPFRQKDLLGRKPPIQVGQGLPSFDPGQEEQGRAAVVGVAS